MAKIFVSHSHYDEDFASGLVEDLQVAGADAWLDENELGGGNFQERINEALADCEWFLLVLTPDALASSWVRMEVDAAIRLKHQAQIRDLIFIKAADVEYRELPALWGVFNILDATIDYESALAKTMKAVGLLPIEKNPMPISVDTGAAANLATSRLTPSEILSKVGDGIAMAHRKRLEGESLHYSGQYDKALVTYDESINILQSLVQFGVIDHYWSVCNDEYRRAWDDKSRTLAVLGRTFEAEYAYAKAQRRLL